MKNTRLFLFAAIAVLGAFLLVFTACEELLEDDVVVASGELMAYAEPLDNEAWFRILKEVDEDIALYVRLDLSECTYDTLNVGDNLGGLIKVSINSIDHIVFNPVPPPSGGKGKITEIILPKATQAILYATDALTIDPEDTEKEAISSAFRHFKNLASITGENVTFIGNFAFFELGNLSTVNFPAVTAIDDFAFAGCKNLSSNSFLLDSFNRAVTIGDYAFKGCTNLTELNFTKVTQIGKNAFEGCEKLAVVIFEDAINIGEKAFFECVKLKEAKFNSDDSAGIEFGDTAFSGCAALEKLYFYNSPDVQFGTGALSNIGTSIEIYLSSGGHGQTNNILGTGAAKTLETITLWLPKNTASSLFKSSVPVTTYIEKTY
jgi:hypothetical protein